jgi:hypothetical protein
VHRRRAPVGHLRLALDPQRLARGGGRRRPGPAEDRRPRAGRPAQVAGRRAGLGEEIVARRKALDAAGGYAYPESQTPWQEIQRAIVGQMETGAVLEPAVKYQRIAQTKGLPRDNH